LRVGYYSPLPPQRSGIADYSALLLPALRRPLDVAVAQRRRFSGRLRVDVCLYHLGNDPHGHDWILAALRRRPGVVVLHEVGLHELVAGMTLGRGDRAAYLDAVERDGGREARLLAQGTLEGLLPPLWETRPLDFPLIDDVIEASIGVIVHSRFAEQRIRERGYAGRVWRIPFPAQAVPVTKDAPLLRDRFPVVSSLGALTRAKRIPQLLDAFALLRRRFPGALLVLAGSGGDGLQLGSRLARLNLKPARDVMCLGHVSESQFWWLLARSDICVSLRWPTLGETSASVIRALAVGRPVVVSDVGWYAELPYGVAARVPVNDREVELLAAMLDLLAENRRLRESIGAAAARYVQAEHDLDRVADAYAEALQEAVEG
jgi:glycosyltransferase involved in cell wall biosynthesis